MPLEGQFVDDGFIVWVAYVNEPEDNDSLRLQSEI